MPTKKPTITKTKAVEKKVSAVKKTPIKKSASVAKLAKKELVIASDETSFWVGDGQILNSLVALKGAFTKMEKSVYLHHIEGGRNDFAEWVGTVLLDSACAADLKKAKTAAAAKTVVGAHLKSYQL